MSKTEYFEKMGRRMNVKSAFKRSQKKMNTSIFKDSRPTLDIDIMKKDINKNLN